MSTAEHRRLRSELYRHLAAAHAGPLGYALIDTVGDIATRLFGIEPPRAPPAPKAELYRPAYGFCAGCPYLGCGPASPSHCLPAKFGELAYSAGKGAERRRIREADYIENDLLPCLDTVLLEMEPEPYRQLLELSKRILLADARQLTRSP
jgi:hypothetical protein